MLTLDERWTEQTTNRWALKMQQWARVVELALLLFGRTTSLTLHLLL